MYAPPPSRSHAHTREQQSTPTDCPSPQSPLSYTRSRTGTASLSLKYYYLTFLLRTRGGTRVLFRVVWPCCARCSVILYLSPITFIAMHAIRSSMIASHGRYLRQALLRFVFESCSCGSANCLSMTFFIAAIILQGSTLR